uniref:Chromosome X open reading frame 38 n=1 Tax=Nothobranchius kadleci TaxID=1051664 RepID=A0A1A8BT80_NOTKA
MVLEELTVRLNDREYTNWLKAGRCLLILKTGLHPFTDHQMRAHHRDLLNQHALLSTPCETSSCKPIGNKLSSPCGVCSEWQKVILRHHRQPGATINWANCFPPHWRTDHWEVAKAYMPRGQAKVRRADQCDAAALLNLINYCRCFWSVDPKLVRQLIQFRNELMHSCELRVKDDWIRHYWSTLKHFVQQLSDVPQMATVGQQIEDMLTVDLSICVSGVDRVDSDGPLEGCESDFVSQLETSAEKVSQWETELLQEMLQEYLHVAAEEDGDAKAQDPEQLKRLQSFLQANKDLREKFSTELQAINSLEVKERGDGSDKRSR